MSQVFTSGGEVARDLDALRRLQKEAARNDGPSVGVADASGGKARMTHDTAERIAAFEKRQIGENPPCGLGARAEVRSFRHLWLSSSLRNGPLSCVMRGN